MKKKIAFIMICILMLSLFTGCKELFSDAIGEITYIDPGDDSIEDYEAETKDPLTEKDITYYDGLTYMMLAIERNDISSFAVTESVAEYIVSKNPDLKITELEAGDGRKVVFPRGYSFLFLEENEALRDSFNEAILALRDNGMIVALQRTFIYDQIRELKMPDITLPHFDNAKTYTVAVTGDLPPLDYVDEKGVPAGYNLALLKEISEYLNININVITIESGARLLALTSKKADIVFWTRCEADEKEILSKYPEDRFQIVFDSANNVAKRDMCEGTITSLPYFSENRVTVVKTK